ncbi:hypothetical protein K8S17_01600 [bacterium]|nr:hypothetical protein [bacterium]
MLLVTAAFFVVLQLTGCASLSITPYVSDPGVSATVHTSRGERFAATLIGTENGWLVLDRSYPKSESLVVVERDGEPVALYHRLPVGTVVEVRAFDVLVRERRRFSSIESVEVATSAYFGWGTLVGALLTCGLIMLTLDD